MANEKEILNGFLVELFNEILRTEEKHLMESGFDNLSVREFHVIEAIANCTKEGKNGTAEIANMLYVTPGTLTVALNVLEKKGYICRKKDENDKRVVRIFNTQIGDEANEIHTKFHHEMIDDCLEALSPEETIVFMRGLSNVNNFFRRKRNENPCPNKK